jgi:hypothetical protein
MRFGRFIVGALGLGALPLALGACGSSDPVITTQASTTQSHITYIGQAQRIVSVKPLGGPAFSIFGQRYRFDGQNYVELQRRFAEPWRVAVENTGGWGGPSSSLTDDQGIEVVQGCQVHPFAVIYGPLDNSGDSLFVQTPHGTVRLPEAAIPQSLRMDGRFFYGATPSMPSGLSVRTPSGRIVPLTESSGRPEGPPCAGGEEPRWAQAHVAQAKAPAALAVIIQCLRRDGFEAGAQPEHGFELGTARWRRYEASRSSCRSDALRAVS